MTAKATAKKKSRATADSGFDKALVKAISHPVRLRAIHILNSRVASPNEIAQEIGKDVNLVAYHVRELVKYDCVELVRTEPRRGATEHFYRATKRAHFRDEEWMQVPKSLREWLLADSLEALMTDVCNSAEGGTFEERADRHWSHTPGAVDETGWGDMQDLLTTTLEAYMKIQTESRERMAASEEDPIRVAMTLLGFEMGKAG